MGGMTGPVRVDTASLSFTLVQLGKTRVNIMTAAAAALDAAAQVLLEQARKEMSLTDHSLQDLARLDHPYAQRHGRIRIHTSRPWRVHKRSGRFLNALSDRAGEDAEGLYHEVYFDLTTAPHARDVLQGTSKMLPRDPLWTGTALQPRVQTAIMRAVVRRLGRELRTQLGVRFERK